MRRTKFGSGERGSLLILVLMLLALGSLLITPSLSLATSGLIGKQVRTEALMEQYCRDAGVEFAMWQLMYGGTAALLAEEGETTTSTVYCNGMEAQVVIRMRATLGQSATGGAEDNRIRISKEVQCDQDGNGFNDDCSSLPEGVVGMVARYTVSLEQVSPDTSVGVTTIYDELPKGFAFRPGSVISQDGSLPEIEGIIPENIGSPPNEIWKWQFSFPVTFVQGEVKEFTFQAYINKVTDRYCNQAFLKLEAPPSEKSAKMAPILVGASPPEGCDDAGVQVVKYVDKRVAPPNVNTVFTYIINIGNIDQNTLHIDRFKDVLPQGGFEYCSPDFPPDDPELSCDPPMFKEADEPFDLDTGDFADTTGFATLDNPVQTYLPGDGRWELLWDGPGGAGWNIAGGGGAGDNIIFRFQAQVTATGSGSYYNEIFADVDCSAPQPLIDEGVTSQEEYCASYSWPTGGVIVPTYDVRSEAGSTSGQGNIDVNWGAGAPEGQLNSWHIN